MQIMIAPLDKKTLADFYQVHSAANQAGWCFCAAWWVPTWEGWGDRTAAENRSARQAQFDLGEFDGYLLYVDGAPAGWCQCGPRDRLPKLVSQFNLPPDPHVWAVTCFLVTPAYRGQGLARQLLEAVLQELKSCGVQRVQGFSTPRRRAFSQRGLDRAGEAVSTSRLLHRVRRPAPPGLQPVSP